MGLIERMMGMVFGGGGNVIRDTAEVFRENTEKSAEREVRASAAVLAQFAAEFERQNARGFFDRLMDGVNRVPRPAMALGTLGLFTAAMVDPVWFSARMQGIALVPEPLWWLLGAVVSFYFGARHQAKGQEFQRSLAETLARTPQVVSNLEQLMPDEAARVTPSEPCPEPVAEERVEEARPIVKVAPPAPTVQRKTTTEANAALQEWRASFER